MCMLERRKISCCFILKNGWSLFVREIIAILLFQRVFFFLFVVLWFQSNCSLCAFNTSESFCLWHQNRVFAAAISRSLAFVDIHTMHLHSLIYYYYFFSLLSTRSFIFHSLRTKKTHSLVPELLHWIFFLSHWSMDIYICIYHNNNNNTVRT